MRNESLAPAAPEPPEPATAPARRGRPRGRRPAGRDTRAEINAAARRLFLAEGYDGVSMRAVARAADVDPALVHHYFHGKSQLFMASVLDVSTDVDTRMDLLPGLPPDQLGAALVRVFLMLWDREEISHVFPTVLRLAGSGEDSGKAYREFLEGVVMPMIPQRDEDPECSARRAELVVSQLMGMAVSRYVLQMPVMVRASQEELVAWLGPTLQRYLDEPPGAHQPVAGWPPLEGLDRNAG